MTVQAKQLGPLVRLERYELLLGSPGTITAKLTDIPLYDISTGPPLGCAVSLNPGSTQDLTDIIRAQFIESTDADDPDGNYLRDLSATWFEGMTTLTGDTSGASATLPAWNYVCTGTIGAPIVPFDRIYKPGGASGASWYSLKQTAWNYIGAGLRAWWLDIYWRNNIAGDQTGGFINGEAVTIK